MISLIFNLRLRLRPMANGWIFSGPNIRLRPKVKIAPTVQHCWALFIYPAKSNIFVGLQIFLHAGCDFLPPEELTPNAKNYDCGYWCLQIWSRNLHNWHFLEIFIQIPKNNSSQSCIICNFAAWKKIFAASTNKTSPWWKFFAAC